MVNLFFKKKRKGKKMHRSRRSCSHLEAEALV